MRVAGVQVDVTLGEVDANLYSILERIGETRDAGAKLTVISRMRHDRLLLQGPR